MKLHDLQYFSGDTNNEYWQPMIDSVTKQWNDKMIDDARYHSQLSFLYSNRYMAEECKMHAALVPDSAPVQEKTLALVGVARILVYEKKIEEALEYYEKSYALEADDEVAIEEAGWCCFELKQWAKAQEWFTKGTLLQKSYKILHEPFWEGLGLSLGQQEKYTEALLAFQKAFELCNKENDGYRYQHLIGQCYANLNDFYRALDYFTKSLDANPTYAKALNDIGALYCNQEGDMTMGIEYFKKAEAIAEKDGNKVILQLVYINLSRIYNQTKEFELQEHYQAKLLEVLGFGDVFGSDDDDEDDGENEEEL